jgi:hypothetical protein
LWRLIGVLSSLAFFIVSQHSPADKDLIAKFAQLFLFWQCRPRFAGRKPVLLSQIARPNAKISRCSERESGFRHPGSCF